MEQLPPELLLHILSYLPIRNLHDVQALNSSFNTLIKENNNQVYRLAASLHQFVDKKVLERDPIHALKDISRHYFSTWMDDVEDWKSFCKKVYLEEALWHGEKPRNLPLHSRFKTLEDWGRGVRGFKVDTEEKTVISTGQMGGLNVFSIDTQEVLWSLPASYAGECTDLEFSNGFLIFRRHGEQMEVWRRSTDAMNPETYLPSNPAASQTKACPDFPHDLFKSHQLSNPSNSSLSSSKHHRSSTSVNPPTSLPRRGAYLPFAILKNPQPVKAFRFVYPYLLLGSKQAFIWDVPRKRLLQIVDIPPPRPSFSDEDGLQDLNYVEINDEFIFTCWTAGLRVYRWRVHDLGQTIGDVVFEYPPLERTDGIPVLYKVWSQNPMRKSNHRPSSETTRVLYQPQDMKWTKAKKIECMPVAVHVSPDGKHLVALINDTHLLYVPDFINATHKLTFVKSTKRRAFERKKLEVPDLFMLEFDFRCLHLAFNGTRAVVSTPVGCIVLNLHDRRKVPSYHSHEKVKGRETVPHVTRIYFTKNSTDYPNITPVSCIQMTDTAIWITYATVQGERLLVNVIDISDLKLLA